MQKPPVDAEEKSLEKVIKKKIEPIIEQSLHRLLGVTIDEVNRDITEKLGRNPLIEFSISPKLPFKKAKKIFKESYLKKLLLVNYGNVSETARIAGVDRRSVHRIAKKAGINVQKIRKDMVKSYEVKQTAVNSIIEGVLKDYREIIHPVKLEKAYENVSDASKEIIENLPEENLTLKEAEEIFEREFIKKALEENKYNIPKTSKEIGIRYETLHRKCKKLGLGERMEKIERAEAKT